MLEDETDDDLWYEYVSLMYIYTSSRKAVLISSVGYNFKFVRLLHHTNISIYTFCTHLGFINYHKDHVPYNYV